MGQGDREEASLTPDRAHWLICTGRPFQLQSGVPGPVPGRWAPARNPALLLDAPVSAGEFDTYPNKVYDCAINV
ncbi:MAG TPA: hypothetical protein PKE45_10410 [Caldilineaceae bacterium]|nr:hypothetical protein [Caldilineaceae bacterium]